MDRRKLWLLFLLSLIFKTTIANDVDLPTVDDNQALTIVVQKTSLDGSIYAQDTWKFVEQLLVCEPEQEANSWPMIAAKAGSIAVPLALGGWLGHKASENLGDSGPRGHPSDQLLKKYNIPKLSKKHRSDELDGPYCTFEEKQDAAKNKENQQFQDAATKWALINGISAGILLLITPIAAYKTTKYFVEKRCNFNAFKDFVINWETYKPWTPVVLHERFDEIFAQQAEMASEEEADNHVDNYLADVCPPLMEKIKHIVQDKYPEKYANTLNNSSFLKWAGALALLLGNVTLIKNLYPTD